MTQNDSQPKLPAKPKQRKPLYRRKWVWITLAAAVLFIGIIGPWPCYSGVDVGSSYVAATFEQAERLPLQVSRGPLSAGAASLDITPPVGEPMAGYGARSPKESAGIAAAIYAKAISLSSGKQTVTIVGGDILIILPELRDAILQRAGLPREEVYFTATHTHSGPGGYDSRWVNQVVLGKYDEAILNRMADAFARVILASRGDMKPAEMSFVQVQMAPAVADEIIVNRLDGSRGLPLLAVLTIRARVTEEPTTVGTETTERIPVPATASVPSVASPPGRGRVIANLVSFNAHPTSVSREIRQIGGDYPGIVEKIMEMDDARDAAKADGIRRSGVTLFAAGAVGSMKPKTCAKAGSATLEQWVGATVAMMANLAVLRAEDAPKQKNTFTTEGTESTKEDKSLGEFRVSPASGELSLAAGIVDVDLPPQQYRISRNLRFSPVLASYLHNRRSYIHILRLNDCILLGMPSDYSSELASQLSQECSAAGSTLRPLVTSFNGDYIGYLLPRSRYDTAKGSEAFDENLFGPWCGEYFNDISRRVLRRLNDSAALGTSP